MRKSMIWCLVLALGFALWPTYGINTGAGTGYVQIEYGLNLPDVRVVENSLASSSLLESPVLVEQPEGCKLPSGMDDVLQDTILVEHLLTCSTLVFAEKQTTLKLAVSASNLAFENARVEVGTNPSQFFSRLRGFEVSFSSILPKSFVFFSQTGNWRGYSFSGLKLRLPESPDTEYQISRSALQVWRC